MQTSSPARPRGLRTASGLALGLLAPVALAARLTLIVAAQPGDAHAPSTVTLGANINAWDPTASGFAFEAGAPGQAARLVLEIADGTLLEFKLTRGSWARVETRADGSPLPNRRHRMRGDATLVLRVARWADEADAKRSTRHTVTGRVDTLKVYSPQLDNTRDVLVWLPPGYEQRSEAYAVLYMHDGLNLFDVATSFVGQEWRVDESADAEARRGRGLIVVGIGAAPGTERLSEYGPFPRWNACKPVARASATATSSCTRSSR